MLAAVAALPLPARGEEWGELQTGYVRDDILTAYYLLGSFYEFPATMQESKETPGRWRIVNAYLNCPSVGGDAWPEGHDNYMIVDASDPVHVYIEMGGTSYFMGQDQQLCVWSIADDYYNNKYNNWELADQEGVCGKLEYGAITFPKGSLLYNPIETLDFDPTKYDYVWKVCNQSGKFRILLPGTPRTDVSVGMMGQSTDAKGIEYYMVLGEDTEYAYAAVFEGAYNPEMAERIRKSVDGSATEDEKVDLVKITESGKVTMPYTGDGIHTVVVLPYADGKSWAPCYDTMEWAYSEDEWKNVGTAEMEEGILCSNDVSEYGFKFDHETMTVKVQQNVRDPWKIRLVDPYGPDSYSYATVSTYDSSRRYYMTFDLGDFDDCMLEYSESIGLKFNAGLISVWCYSDRAKKGQLNPVFIEQYYPNGLPKGHFDPDTNVLTFEEKALNVQFSANPVWYAANNDGSFQLKLNPDIKIEENPDSGISCPGAVTSETEAEYYTLSGIRLSGKPASGTVIEKRGDKVRKIIVK